MATTCKAVSEGAMRANFGSSHHRPSRHSFRRGWFLESHACSHVGGSEPQSYPLHNTAYEHRNLLQPQQQQHRRQCYAIGNDGPARKRPIRHSQPIGTLKTAERNMRSSSVSNVIWPAASVLPASPLQRSAPRTRSTSDHVSLLSTWSH